VPVLRSREHGCFLVVQTLWAEKIQSTTDAGSLNTFGRNQIEVALISSALLRIACLVILNKTCRVPDQELAADRVSSSNFTVCLFAFENRSGIAAGKARTTTSRASTPATELRPSVRTRSIGLPPTVGYSGGPRRRLDERPSRSAGARMDIYARVAQIVTLGAE
jgi:hypothetical protein